METKEIVIKQDGPICTVTINRPQVLNALTRETKKELRQFFLAAAEEESVRAVILTGQGERAFCTGTDVRDMASFTCREAEDMLWLEHGLNDAIRNCPKPVIAAVNGHAVGGGCLIPLMCDYSVVSEEAVLGFPEINNGIPASIEIAVIHKFVGLARARQMVYFGESFSPKQALDWGLVNEVVPRDRVLTRAEEIAAKFLSKSPTALRMQKQLVNKWIETDFKSAVEASIYAFGLSFSTGEPQQAIASFLEKRKNRNG